jgi:hypothetical protein
MEKININKSLIKAYKYMLIHKLQDSNHWSLVSTKESFWTSKSLYEYEHAFNNNGVSVKFKIKFDNTIELRITSVLVHTFTMFGNLDLYSKVLNFKKSKKNEGARNERNKYEDLMKRALPDDYKRAIKISKIKDKL